ncbi:MAG: hypothetical protein ACHQ3P_02910 [Candidatus Limnocylindrales bacterium]
MSTRMPFDQRLVDWLEEGPTDAPDQVLETILAALPSIPQRRAALRVPRRFTEMTLSARVVTAAVIGVLVIGGAFYLFRPGGANLGPAAAPTPTPEPTPTALLTPSPTPSVALTPVPSPTETPTPLPSFTVRSGPPGYDQVHVSDVYRYGLRYPSNWTLQGEGGLLNETDAIPQIGLGRNDLYGDQVGSSVYVTAGPLSTVRPDLATFSAFAATHLPTAYSMYSGTGCKQATRTLALDGEPAIEHDYFCPLHTALWLVAIHGGLVYQVAWLDDGPFTAGELRPKFDKVLQSFTFAP